MSNNPRPPRKITDVSKLLQVNVLGVELVEIIHHAIIRMKERGVSDRDVLEALRNPDQTGLPTQPGRSRVRWNRTHRVAIEVVFEKMKDRVRVITVTQHIRRLGGRRR